MRNTYWKSFLTYCACAAILAMPLGCKSAPRIPLAQKAGSAVGLDRIFQNEQQQLASSHAKREMLSPYSAEKKPFWKFWGNSKPRVVSSRTDPTRLSNKVKVGSDVHISAARIHEGRGDLAAAATAYSRALEADKNNEIALLGFARLYDRNSRFDEAAKLYEQSVKSHAESSRSHNDYGLCLVRQGKTPEGLKHLSRAVELEPNSPRYRNNIAQVLACAGRIEDALAHQRHVHSEAGAHYNIAHWLQQAGNNDAALSHYVKASELDPQLEQAKAMVAQLQNTLASNPAPYAPSTPPSSNVDPNAPFVGQVYNGQTR